MTTTHDHDHDLDALEDALRRSVERQVEGLTARARDEAGMRIRRAQHEADDLARRAREEGNATADATLVRANAEARRQSTTIVLEAKCAALEELHARVREAVMGLRDAPDYPQLLDALTTRARARLGADAHIVRDLPELGGIVAEIAGRRVDYTLPALADRALDEMGDALSRLWA